MQGAVMTKKRGQPRIVATGDPDPAAVSAVLELAAQQNGGQPFDTRTLRREVIGPLLQQLRPAQQLADAWNGHRLAATAKAAGLPMPAGLAGLAQRGVSVNWIAGLLAAAQGQDVAAAVQTCQASPPFIAAQMDRPGGGALAPQLTPAPTLQSSGPSASPLFAAPPVARQSRPPGARAALHVLPPPAEPAPEPVAAPPPAPAPVESVDPFEAAFALRFPGFPHEISQACAVNIARRLADGHPFPTLLGQDPSQHVPALEVDEVALEAGGRAWRAVAVKAEQLAELEAGARTAAAAAPAPELPGAPAPAPPAFPATGRLSKAECSAIAKEIFDRLNALDGERLEADRAHWEQVKADGAKEVRAELETAHAGELEQLRADHAGELEQLRTAHAGELEGIQRGQATELERQKSAHATALEDLRGAHAAELAALRGGNPGAALVSGILEDLGELEALASDPTYLRRADEQAARRAELSRLIGSIRNRLTPTED